MVQVRCAAQKRVRAGSSSTTGARSAAPPACSDGFDDVDGGPECGVYIQMRGIEQVRIRRGFERRGCPFGVALIPAQDVGEDLGFVDRAARRPAIRAVRRPARTSRGRGHENLHVGVGEDHRSDVAAIEHRARRGAAEAALERKQRRADLGDRRDQRGGLADSLALERRLVERPGSSASAAASARTRSPGEWPASSSAFATAR